MFIDMSMDYDLEGSSEFVAEENAYVGGTVRLYGTKFKVDMSTDTAGGYFKFFCFSHSESQSDLFRTRLFVHVVLSCIHCIFKATYTQYMTLFYKRI
jgi:hypothetical protein